MNHIARIIPFLAVACTTPAEPDVPDPVEESDNPIDQLFAGLGTLPSDPPHYDEGTPSVPIVDGDYECVDTPVDEARQLDQLLGQIAIGDVLWPGSMLRGESAYSGRLTPLGFERAPLTFSVSLESLGGGARSATMESPSLSSYRDAVAQLLAQELTGSTPARIYAEVEEVSSEEQLAVALGASASAPLVGMVKGGFDFTDTTKRSRFVVKFFQLYYTVDVDPPYLPHQFFGPSVTADQIADNIGDDPPLYVSSIGYGRQVIFTFESELATSELSAALEFAYHGGGEIAGQASLTHQEVLGHTHTTAFILGGDAGEAASASIGGYEELRAFISRGGNYSATSPGAAIAYKLSYVRDNSPVLLTYASTYSKRVCTRHTQRLHVVLERVTVDDAGTDAGGDLEVFGNVITVGTTQQVLESWTSDNYVQIAEGASYPASGVIAESVVPVRPQPGAKLVIMTSLSEADALSNDSFGENTMDSFPFEAGWRRTVDVHRSSGTQAITLSVRLTPVP
jgi:thiol-activated cytolysin